MATMTAKDQSVPQQFQLTISADSITSTDEHFTMDNISLGDSFKPIDAFFKANTGEVIRRNRDKNERAISNQTLPRIACQVFEDQIKKLPKSAKEAFPVCQYRPDSKMIRGIYSSEAEFRAHHNSIEFLTYKLKNGESFVIYSWNIFSTISFVQECLKRFGEPGDRFVLQYRRKETENAPISESPAPSSESGASRQIANYEHPLSSVLIKSKNVILRGAPGTGKTYLAKRIAAEIVSNGVTAEYDQLTAEQKEQMEFVQFHPSYDYSDFVEGLRPILRNDDTMGFELEDGIFKAFVKRARNNYENARKPLDVFEKEVSDQQALSSFLSNIELGVDTFKTLRGKKFTVTDITDGHIDILVPDNEVANTLRLNINSIKTILEGNAKLIKVEDVKNALGKTYGSQLYSYYFALVKEIEKLREQAPAPSVQQEALKNYVFIIDEINRGEISKIFGELFFSIDPGYRGESGSVSTQYANMHANPHEKFFIPDNVYIIGTMNDIDRSVDTFDFAMRRRFRFIELKANEQVEMLAALEDDALRQEAIERMAALNNAIARAEDLNENYQIGASYFLKLNILTFDQLWTDYLQPLLHDYIQGSYNEDELMHEFAQAYGYPMSTE